MELHLQEVINWLGGTGGLVVERCTPIPTDPVSNPVRLFFLYMWVLSNRSLPGVPSPNWVLFHWSGKKPVLDDGRDN